MGFLSRFKIGAKTAWSPAEFWNWFQSAEGQRAAETAHLTAESQEALLRSLSRLHPDLSWGIQPKGEDGSPGVLEISAGGLRDLIPVVQKVVTEAPTVDGWKIVAFKQPVADFSVRLGNDGEQIDSDTVMVVPTKLADGRFDLAVYVPTPAGCPPKTNAELGFIFLDHILGEFAVMDRLAALSFDSTLVAPPGKITLASFAEQLAA